MVLNFFSFNAFAQRNQRLLEQQNENNETGNCHKMNIEIMDAEKVQLLVLVRGQMLCPYLEGIIYPIC